MLIYGRNHHSTVITLQLKIKLKKNFKVSIILNGEILSAFLLRSETRQRMSTLTIQHFIGGLSQSNKERKRSKLFILERKK